MGVTESTPATHGFVRDGCNLSRSAFELHGRAGRFAHPSIYLNQPQHLLGGIAPLLQDGADGFVDPQVGLELRS